MQLQKTFDARHGDISNKLMRLKLHRLIDAYISIYNYIYLYNISLRACDCVCALFLHLSPSLLLFIHKFVVLGGAPTKLTGSPSSNNFRTGWPRCLPCVKRWPGGMPSTWPFRMVNLGSSVKFCDVCFHLFPKFGQCLPMLWLSACSKGLSVHPCGKQRSWPISLWQNFSWLTSIKPRWPKMVDGRCGQICEGSGNSSSVPAANSMLKLLLA